MRIVASWRRIAGMASAVLLLCTLLLAVFPWGLVAAYGAPSLSRALGRPITIGAARRVDWISFMPTIELGDVTVAQPAWVGGGDMARIRKLRMRVPALPLLLGRIRPRAIEVDGAALRLVRDAAGRDNWSGKRGGGGATPRLAELTIRDGHLRLDDARRHVTLDADVSSDRMHGLRVEGTGTLRGAPLQLTLVAPAIATADIAKPYPARVSIRSPLASIAGMVRMDHPLDTTHFTAAIVGSGRDLGYLDDILQVGLFRTQSFRLGADIRRDGPDWNIPRLDAAIGRSNLRAALRITKPGGRTHLDGRIDARALDFDDFASDEQRARAAADTARIGPRVVPDTRIVLDKLNFDGRLQVHVARLLSHAASPFLGLDGTATLDHRRLALSPLAVRLPRGRLTGTAVVDDRGRAPRLALDLRVAGSAVDSFFPAQQVVSGPLRARVRLAGSGPTVREALAHGEGTIGIAVDRGSMRTDYATFLGGDVLKSVGAAARGSQPRTALDCLTARFVVSRGRATPRPLILSTPIARGDGTGAVTLGPETIDLRITGRPLRPGPLLSTAPVRLFGTLSRPQIDIRPPRAENQKQKGILSRVGFFIKKLRVRGDTHTKAATPFDCRAEVRDALE